MSCWFPGSPQPVAWTTLPPCNFARAAGKSLNEAAVDALAEGSGMAGTRRKRRDLGDIARTWKADKAVVAALADQDRVDEDLWR